MMQILDTVDRLTELTLPDDPPHLLAVVKVLITLRNAAEYQLAAGAAMMDRLGMAKKAGSMNSKLLQANGAPPAAACRWVRVGDHAIAAAPPSEVEKIARSLGNQAAKDTGGLPPAEEPALNSLDYAINTEGRLAGRFDVDAQIGEELFSALDYWSNPRPKPDGSDGSDGSDDARTTTQRHADALHQLLVCGGGGGQDLVSAPRTDVMVSIPADHPDQASLPWMGPITEALACDSTITSITLNGQNVPIDLSPPRRLFTGQVRTPVSAGWAACDAVRNEGAQRLRDERRARIKARPVSEQ